MPNANSTTTWKAQTLDELSGNDPHPIKMQDRATPAWTVVLSILFSGGAAACFVALAVFVVFYQDLVAIQGQEIMAYLLTMGAIVPIVGILIFEIGHNKALAGYRHIRERNAAIGQMLVALLVSGALGFIDPLLLIPFVSGAVLSWAVIVPLGRFLPVERFWEFLPAEAVAFLSGRDQRALELANSRGDNDPLLDNLLWAVRLLVLMVTVALGSWLAAREVISLPAIASIALLNYWSTRSFSIFFRTLSKVDPELEGRAAKVTLLADQEAEEEDAAMSDGLRVRNLSVVTRAGYPLLSDVSFDLETGSIVGVCGDEFAGKSTLMQALVAPHDLKDLEVQGLVSIAGDTPWFRSAKDRDIPAILVPPTPLTVPGGGLDNLSCFVPEAESQRARRMLKALVHNTDTVDHICRARDVSVLSGTDKKALALARALFLRPRLFLFDRPEDGASIAVLRALADRMQDEARLGGMFLVATENRQILDICDKLLMLQNGRMVELAPAAEISARRSAGWARFVSDSDLDSEDALDSWICAQFRRDGDEENRRKVCMIANEMLALACQPRNGLDLNRSISFEFKHQKGHCVLQLIEKHALVSTASLDKARQQVAQATEGGSLPPLARIVKHALSVETSEIAGKHLLQVTIETYDPRLAQSGEVNHHAKQTG